MEKKEENVSVLFHVSHQKRYRLFYDKKNTEQKAENEVRIGVVLRNVELFNIMWKHCCECLI